MNNPTLLVPIEVNALVINSCNFKKTFRRWEMSYRSLIDFKSSDPNPIGNESDGGFEEIGVCLHWMLPEALRHGVHSSKLNKVQFPKVPNRWLIVRFSGSLDKRVARSFIVESDTFGDSKSSTYIFDENIIDAWQNSGNKDKEKVAANLKDNMGIGQIGQNYDLKGWKENGIGKLFLTAVAPGNPLFSVYQSHCKKVFSFHDKLEGVKYGETLSYFVTGWYSNDDPILECQLKEKSLTNDWEEYQKLLENNNWKVLRKDNDNDLNQNTNEEEVIPQSSLYHGAVFGIQWLEDKDYKNMPEDKDRGIHVAIGNSTIDAFKAIIDQQLKDKAGDEAVKKMLDECPYVSKILEAFQYDMLDILDKPNGNSLLEYRIHQEWFNSKTAGYSWIIVDDDTKKSTNKADEQRKLEEEQESWLSDLNSDQLTLDNALRELHENQKELYSIWWKKGLFHTYKSFNRPKNLTEEQFINALDPNNENSLPYKIYKQMNLINSELMKKVPHPIYENDDDTPEKAFDAGIRAFEKEKRDSGKLGENRILKAISAPRFWKMNDPVVLISGAGNISNIKSSKEKLGCRLSTDIINGLIFKKDNISARIEDFKDSIPELEYSSSQLGEAMAGKYINPDTAVQLGEVIYSLIDEFYLLDPFNACSIAKKYPCFTQDLINKHDFENFNGVLPEYIPDIWQQPWKPLFIRWVANWYPIDYEDLEGKRCWSFDGTEYHYNGNSKVSRVNPIGGDIFLTPQTSFIFKDRLEKFITENNEDAEKLLSNIDDLIEKIDNWDFISQSLVGFSNQLALRDVRTNRAPDKSEMLRFHDGAEKTLIDLIGNEYNGLPYISASGKKDESSVIKVGDFNDVRQGQFNIESFAIYDTFGQKINVVGESGLISSDKFLPIIAEGLIPDKSIKFNNLKNFIQLKPSLIQHSRLNFNLVDIIDISRTIDTDPYANPIEGWFLSNHLDLSISLYDFNGFSAGEIIILENEEGNKEVNWMPCPYSSYDSLQKLEKVAPSLVQIINSIKNKGVNAFYDFLDIIDSALWCIDPLDVSNSTNRSILAGRPLALIRAKLEFELEGRPISEAGWDATFNTPIPKFINYDFEVRVGDSEIRNDGLIGYYLNQNFDYFNSVHILQEISSDYIRPIGKGNFITLKFDGKSFADLLLLADPRASINAVSGILPVKTIYIAEKFVKNALHNLEISFMSGSVLTKVRQNINKQQTEGEEPTESIELSMPEEKSGMWLWAEKQYINGEERWNEYALSRIDAKARFEDKKCSLREGYLVYKADVKNES